MEKQEEKISVKALAEEIAFCVKEELVAIYKTEEDGAQIRFTNGQKFRIFVEELRES